RRFDPAHGVVQIPGNRPCARPLPPEEAGNAIDLAWIAAYEQWKNVPQRRRKAGGEKTLARSEKSVVGVNADIRVIIVGLDDSRRAARNLHRGSPGKPHERSVNSGR